MFEKMSDAGLARRLIGGTDPVPHHMRHDRRAVVGDHHHVHPVRQGEFSGRQVKGQTSPTAGQQADTHKEQKCYIGKRGDNA